MLLHFLHVLFNETAFAYEVLKLVQNETFGYKLQHLAAGMILFEILRVR